MRARNAIHAAFLWLACVSLVSGQRIEREFIVNAIKITLLADRPILDVNEPVTVKYTISNTSKLEIPISPLFWIVRREDGKSVADTPEGLRRKAAMRAPKTVNVLPHLGPDANSTGVEDISKIYVMDQPGVYIVNAEMGVTDEVKTDFVKSNTLRITIR